MHSESRSLTRRKSLCWRCCTVMALGLFFIREMTLYMAQEISPIACELYALETLPEARS